MSADNRSTHTDALATLGTIIGPEEARDAIHLGVEPVVASRRLYPGDHVGLLPDGTAGDHKDDVKMIGIVDPFLENAVQPGERFWLIVYPRQITSLRHVWTHPDFPAAEFEKRDEPAPKPKRVPARARTRKPINVPVPVPAPVPIIHTPTPAEVSEKWIRDYVDQLNSDHYDSYYKDSYGSDELTYEEMMDAARSHGTGGWNYITKGGMFEGVGVKDEFWHHFTVVTGIEPSDPSNFFSCSC